MKPLPASCDGDELELHSSTKDENEVTCFEIYSYSCHVLKASEIFVLALGGFFNVLIQYALGTSLRGR